MMKVTVCEMPDARRAFDDAWTALVEHVRESQSGLVLLPQMPFCGWFLESAPDSAVWTAAVQAHDAWEHRLAELAPAVVLGTRPIDFGNERYEEAFVWEPELGLRSIHANCRPTVGRNDSRWYVEATPEFTPVEVRDLRIGFLIAGELWLQSEARRYGQEDVDVIAIPRSAGRLAFAQALEAACADAQSAGAYAISSNRSGPFGGRGWIIGPDGRVIGTTSESSPFLSLDIETPLARARAGQVQPRPADPWIDPLDTGVPPF